MDFEKLTVTQLREYVGRKVQYQYFEDGVEESRCVATIRKISIYDGERRLVWIEFDRSFEMGMDFLPLIDDETNRFLEGERTIFGWKSFSHKYECRYKLRKDKSRGHNGFWTSSRATEEGEREGLIVANILYRPTRVVGKEIFTKCATCDCVTCRKGTTSFCLPFGDDVVLKHVGKISRLRVFLKGEDKELRLLPKTAE